MGCLSVGSFFRLLANERDGYLLLKLIRGHKLLLLDDKAVVLKLGYLLGIVLPSHLSNRDAARPIIVHVAKGAHEAGSVPMLGLGQLAVQVGSLDAHLERLGLIKQVEHALLVHGV